VFSGKRELGGADGPVQDIAMRDIVARAGGNRESVMATTITYTETTYTVTQTRVSTAPQATTTEAGEYRQRPYRW